MSDVIPFPRRPVAQPVSEPANEDANERLYRALQRLEEALTRQRAAIATWQNALGDLKSSVTGLGTKFGHFNGALTKLQENVGSLHAASVELGSRADRLSEIADAPPAP